MTTESIKFEVRQLLSSDDLLLGAIYRAMAKGIANALEIAKETGASNRGVFITIKKWFTRSLMVICPRAHQFRGMQQDQLRD